MPATPTVEIVDGPSFDVFLGDTQKLVLRFDNTGAPGETGFAPYIDLYIPHRGIDGASAAPLDGVTFDGASYLGQRVDSFVLTFNAQGKALHPFARDQNGNALVLNGAVGEQVVVLRLPFGSFTEAQTPAQIDVLLDLSKLADVGKPLPIKAQGGFAFGADALDNLATDPVILGQPAVGSINPVVARLEVSYSGPEQETATGPSYDRYWHSEAVLAKDQVFKNLIITDTLPDGTKFLDAKLTNGVNGPVIGTVQAIANADGTTTLIGRVDGTVIGGAVKPVLSSHWYATEFLHDGTPVLDPRTGSFRDLEQNSKLTADWTPLDTRDANPTKIVVDDAGSENVVVAKSIAIQKDVDLVSPKYQANGVLEYTLDGQVSNYFEIKDLIVTDVMGDGQTFSGAFTPTLRVTEGPLSGLDVPLVVGGVKFFTVGAKDANGKTTISFDVSGALKAAGLDGVLDGNNGALQQTPHATDYKPTLIRIVFQSTLDEHWQGPVPGDTFVDQGDTVGNEVDYGGVVLTPGNDGTFIEDDSGAEVVLPNNVVGKAIFAVNGDTGLATNTFGKPVQLQAGDLITYRLTLDLPLTSSHGIRLSDYLPLPVLTSGNLTYDASTPIPRLNEFRFGPDDHWLATTGIMPTLSFDTKGNALHFDFGGVAGSQLLNGSSYPETHLDLLFTVRVNDERFGDGLFLTNQVTSLEKNSQNEPIQTNAIIQFLLGEPSLRVTKGIIATTNAESVLTGSVVPAGISFNGPGTAGPRFAGGTISSDAMKAGALDANLAGADAGDIVTFAITVENLGRGWKGAFDAVIKDVMPAGFVVPAGGLNLFVTDGTGKALAYDILTGGLFGDGIQLVDQPGQDGALDPFSQTSGTNLAIVTFDLMLAGNLPVPQEALVNTGKVASYAAQEGGTNFAVPGKERLEDTANVSVFPTMTKVVASTTQTTTGPQGKADVADVTIGGTVTYTITVKIPEGVMSSVVLQDLLPKGAAGALQAVSGTLTKVGAGLTGNPSLTTGLAATLSDSDATPDGIADLLTWNLGTITNAPNNLGGADDELVFTVVAVVPNDARNAAGDELVNTARLTAANPNGGKDYVLESTANVEIVEPRLAISKVVTPNSGDADDVFHYSITLTNVGGSSGGKAFASTAYDVSIADLLTQFGTAVVYNPASLQIFSAPAYSNASIVTGTQPGQTIALKADSLKTGDSITIRFSATAPTNAPAGAQVVNTAEGQASSLPGVVAGERTGGNAGPDAGYKVTSSATIEIKAPSAVKEVFKTSFDDTGAGQMTAGVPDVKANEVVTYHITITLPEGESPNLRVQDVLADVLSGGTGSGALDYVAGSARVVSVGSKLKGLGGQDLSKPVITSSDTGGNGNVDFLSFAFGNILNEADNSAPGPADRIVIELQAIARDVPANERGDVLRNTATILTDKPGGGTSTVVVTADVDFVEPLLKLEKSADAKAGDAGNVVTYTLRISHDAASTANAYNLVLADILPAGVTFVANSLTTSAGSASFANGTINLTLGTYALGTTPALTPAVVVTYKAVLDDTVVHGAKLTNTATLDYKTDPVPAQARDLPDLKAQATVDVAIPNSIEKQFVGGDNPFTTGKNLTAGETVTYKILATIGEGTQTLVLADTLPGGLVFQSATLKSVASAIQGANLSPAGVWDAGTRTVSFDFGKIVNPGNNAGADQIEIEVVAKVADGVTGSLTNTGKLTPGVPTGNPYGVPAGPGDTQTSTVVSPVVYAEVGDLAFEDLNGDGIRQGNEKGVSGVTVELRSKAGDLVATTTTDASGLYSFKQVIPGEYYEVFAKPPSGNWQFTIQGQGTPATDSDADPVTGRGANFSLMDNAVDLTRDVGLYRPITLGDFVWEDKDGDGVQDGDETGIADVVVSLSGPDGPRTTKTDANGKYEFAGLRPGDYTVTFDKPAGWAFSPAGLGGNGAKDSDASPATGKVAVKLTSGVDNPDVDAGLYRPVTIGDRAWVDVNGNGIQDTGEKGLAGVTVILLDKNGQQVGAPKSTDGDGKYEFAGLAPGQYQVKFTPPAGWNGTEVGKGAQGSDSDADPASGVTPLKAYRSGDVDDGVDAGFWQAASLGDRVWYDADGDGIQDNGETGVKDLTVQLLSADGNTVIGTTTTGLDGIYGFSGLAPGQYVVQFTKPAGWSFTQAGAGTPGTDSNANPATGRTAPVTLASGQNDGTVDAGVWQPVTIGNRAWVDANGNGIQDTGENGLNGVLVTLVDVKTGQTAGTATTKDGGQYQFVVPPGDYKLVFAPPSGSGYVLTIPGQGTAGTDSDPAPATGETKSFPMAGGQTDNSWDAGFYIPVRLGDFVFEDQNGDGLQDAGDTPMVGLTVKLRNGAGDVVATTTTDVHGGYEFAGLRPGLYQVQFTKPGGFSYTASPSGADPAKDSDADVASGLGPLKLYASGDVDMTLDAGMWRPVSIGNFAWLDGNGNGIQDGNEGGLAGVTVNLYDATTGKLLATQTTGASGAYQFTNLKPGSFYEEWTAPVGYVFTKPNAGTAGLDSDVLAQDQGAGKTAVFAVRSGTYDDTRDGGLYMLASVKGLAFLDLPSGVCSPKVPGAVFAGVTVQLVDLQGKVVASTITGADGTYTLGGVAPGTYQVKFVAPSGLTLVAKGAGNAPVHESDVDPATGLSDQITLFTNTHLTGIQAGFSHVTGTAYDAAPVAVGPGFAHAGPAPGSFASSGGNFITNAGGTFVTGAHQAMDNGGGMWAVAGAGATSLMTLGQQAKGYLYGSTGFMMGEGSPFNDIIIAGCGGSNNQAMGAVDDGTRDWNLLVGGDASDLMEGNHGKTVFVGNDGNDRLFGFGEMIAGKNDGKIQVANGVASGLAWGDTLILSGLGPTTVRYNEGDGVQVILGFDPTRGDRIEVYGHAAPTAITTADGMGVLYFGPDQAIVLHNWQPAWGPMPGGITFHADPDRMPGAFGDFKPLPPVVLGPAQTVFRGTQSDDIAVGSDAGTTFIGGDGQDLLMGGAGNDVFLLGTGGSTALGGRGNDMIVGATGSAPDSMRGGAGDDVYVVTNRWTEIVEKPGEGQDTAFVTVDDWRVSDDVEVAALSGAATRMTGGATAQTLFANANAASEVTAGTGKTVLVGGAVGSVLRGNDLGGTFLGQGGADTYVGGAGDDTFVVNNAATVVTEGAGGGRDTAMVNVNGWTVANHVDVVLLLGNASAVNLGTSGALIVSNPTLGSIITAAGGPNYFFGGAGNDTFTGGAGNDVFFGGTGATKMVGGAGDDIYVVNNAFSEVIEATNGGYDIAWAQANGWKAGANVDLAVLNGTATVLAGNDTGGAIFANAKLGSHLIAGANGTPMTGSGFADTFDLGAGQDVLTLGGGADQIRLGAGPIGVNGVTDFSGHWGDGDRLDFRGSGITSMDDLTIARFGDTVLVAYAQGAIGLWNSTQDLTAQDFIFS